MTADLTRWADALEGLVRASAHCTRVVVLARTASTQDAAVRLCGGRPGTVVVTTDQTAGRGRLGRSWLLPPGTGLACSCTLDADAPEGRRSLQAGLAAAVACESVLPPGERIGLRWPNDVVSRSDGRKLAGALVERRGSLHVLGLGVNVEDPPAGWPEGLRAVSLRALGSDAAALDVAAALIRAIDHVLTLTPDALVAQWRPRDLLLGTRATFEHAGRRFTGTVRAIDPISQIRLTLDTGREIMLPAQTTSLVHADAVHVAPRSTSP